MYILDCILFLGVVITIICTTVSKVSCKENKYTKIIYFLPTVLSIIHFILCKFNYLAAPIYMSSIALILMHIQKKKKIIYIVMCISAIALLLIPLGITVNFEVKNYASTSYVHAFENLNKQLKENYPFTEWKRVDFNKKYAEYIERFRNEQR